MRALPVRSSRGPSRLSLPSGGGDPTVRQRLPAPSESAPCSRGVVADAVGEAAVADGVVGEDDGDAGARRAAWRGGAAQFVGEVDGAADAVGVGRVGARAGIRCAACQTASALWPTRMPPMRPSSSGRTTCMREVFGGEALQVGGPLRSGAAALDELDHRGVGAGEGVLSLSSRPSRPRAKPVRLRMAAAGGAPRRRAGTKRRQAASLSVGDDERDGVEGLRFRAR